MEKLPSPWLARRSWLGAVAGLVAAAALAALAPAGAAAWLGGIACVAAAYLAAVASPSVGQLARAQGRNRSLRLELRAAQDHLMAHGSSRSLPAWLAESAEPLREAIASVSRESRSLVAEVSLPEPV